MNGYELAPLSDTLHAYTAAFECEVLTLHPHLVAPAFDMWTISTEAPFYLGCSNVDANWTIYTAQYTDMTDQSCDSVVLGPETGVPGPIAAGVPGPITSGGPATVVSLATGRGRRNAENCAIRMADGSFVRVAPPAAAFVARTAREKADEVKGLRATEAVVAAQNRAANAAAAVDVTPETAPFWDPYMRCVNEDLMPCY